MRKTASWLKQNEMDIRENNKFIETLLKSYPSAERIVCTLQKVPKTKYISFSFNNSLLLSIICTYLYSYHCVLLKFLILKISLYLFKYVIISVNRANR